MLRDLKFKIPDTYIFEESDEGVPTEVTAAYRTYGLWYPLGT